MGLFDWMSKKPLRDTSRGKGREETRLVEEYETLLDQFASAASLDTVVDLARVGEESMGRAFPTEPVEQAVLAIREYAALLVIDVVDDKAVVVRRVRAAHAISLEFARTISVWWLTDGHPIPQDPRPVRAHEPRAKRARLLCESDVVPEAFRAAARHLIEAGELSGPLLARAAQISFLEGLEPLQRQALLEFLD